MGNVSNQPFVSIRKQLTRRNLFKGALIGVATSVASSAAASASVSTDNLTVSPDLQTLISAYQNVNQARLYLDQNWPNDSNQPAIVEFEQRDEQLYKVEAAYEEKVCVFPCLTVGDVFAKVDFTRRFLSSHELDWSWQHASILQSIFPMLGSERNHSEFLSETLDVTFVCATQKGIT